MGIIEEIDEYENKVNFLSLIYNLSSYPKHSVKS